MGLVGYQVQKENEENDKRLKHLQEMAKQATLIKAEKKKNNLSLPMRGRHMFIGDKNRDQYMRCEFFKQANENEEILNEQKNLRFLDHVKYYEEQLAMRKMDKDQKMPIGVIQALQKKSLRDFKPLKTKAFDFSQQVVRNMSANNAFGQ
jgi:hypothetical protein